MSNHIGSLWFGVGREDYRVSFGVEFYHLSARGVMLMLGPIYLWAEWR